MIKQFLNTTLILLVILLTGFKIKTNELWTATLKLEGKSKSYILNSEAVYGGFNNEEKKFYLFGKNHMFQCKENAEVTKAFQDLCVLNGSGQFEFQLSGINSIATSTKTIQGSGQLNLLKKGGQFKASFKYPNQKGKEISLNGNLSQLGFTLDEQASKLFSGNFSLKFSSNK